MTTENLKYELTSEGKAVPSCWRTSTQGQDSWNVLKLKGFWIWWCRNHRQPIAWCEKYAWANYAADLKERLKKVAALANGEGKKK